MYCIMHRKTLVYIMHAESLYCVVIDVVLSTFPSSADLEFEAYQGPGEILCAQLISCACRNTCLRTVPRSSLTSLFPFSPAAVPRRSPSPSLSSPSTPPLTKWLHSYDCMQTSGIPDFVILSLPQRTRTCPGLTRAGCW